MKKTMFALAGIYVFGCWGVNWDNAMISGTTPGGQMFFEPNEEMVFTLKLEGVKEALPSDTYFVDWERRGDDGLTQKGRAALPFPSGGLVLKTKTAKPGFVCIEANVVTKDGRRVPKNHRWEKRVFFQGGAGVRPNEIPMAAKPVDYEAFWRKCLAELDAVPIKAEMKPVDCKDKLVKLYAVTIACAGPQPVTGYLTIPVAASKTNRMPISAGYRGASEDEQLAPAGGPHDRISMLINPNGYELGRGKEYVKKFFREVAQPGFGYGMGPKQNENPDTCYWKYCALRAIRYLQWLKTLPEWNGKELVLGGGSQGDWQCYFGAAFVPGVTRMNGNGSWGCDWTGQSTLGRLKSTYRPGCWYPGMAYFDPVFVADRITCPVDISFSGLGDYVSPPSSLTLVYRNLKGPKKITYVQGSTHGWRPNGMQRFTVDGGFDAAVKPGAEPGSGDAKRATALLASRDIVYWLDASRTNSLVCACQGEGALTTTGSQGEGALTTTGVGGGKYVKEWKSVVGGYSFKSMGSTPKAGKDSVAFDSTAKAVLVGSGVVTQRTVFVVCRPRATRVEFAGVWGEKGKDNGLRVADKSCAWENVHGGPDFNSVGSLMVNGNVRTGAVGFNPGETQVLALRHDADIPLWGSCSRPVFVPALGGYVGGRLFDGEILEVVAFSKLLGEDDCRAISAALDRKWTPVDAASSFDPLDAVRRDLAAGKKDIRVAKRVSIVKPKDGGAYLSLKGLSDVTIDFEGGELRGLVNTCFFRLEACTNVTIRNVTLDYVTLPFTQGEIVAADTNATWTVKLIPGYPVAPDGDRDAWPFQVYDRSTLELKNPMRCWNGFKIEKTGSDTYRVSGGGDRRGTVGDYVVWGLPKPRGEQEGDHVSACDAVYSRATVRCVFENITEYATPGGRAFEEHLTEGNVYRNCSIVRRPPETDPVKRGLKRLRSGNHDAFMSRRAVEGPKLFGCTAMYHCDDAVNISGMYGVVYAVEGKKVRLLEYIPSVFHVGDSVQAMSSEGAALPPMKVASVKSGLAMTDAERAYVKTIGLWRGLDELCKTAVEIEVDDPSALKRGDAVISNRAQGNGFEIRGCRFGRNRAFCVRLRASHGTIADNIFDRSEGTGLYLGPEYEWLEGGLAEDVRIENNVFVDRGISIAGTAARKKRLPRSAYRNVVETNNVFTKSEPVAARIDPIGYIKNEIARGVKRISLPKARYWLTPKPGERCYLELKSLRDVEIDFNGSEFVGTVVYGMVSMSGCTNVTLRNLVIDYADLPFTQAVIEKVDAEKNWDVRVVEGYPCPPVNRLGGYGDAHNNDECFWPIQAYGAKTHEPVNFMRFRDHVAITRTGERTYRITGGQNRRGDVGDIAVWTIREPGSYAASSVGASFCTGCTFENVVVYSTPHGCAFSEGSAEGNVYRGCAIDRRPLERDIFPRAMRRLRSGNHDAFNSRCSYKGPVLENCTFRYHCDDCVNISGFYAFVTKREGRKLRLVSYGGGRDRIAVGDSCQLMTDDGRTLPDAKAVVVRDAGPITEEDRKLFPSFKLWQGLTQAISCAFEIELDEERDLPPGSAIISNRRMGNGFVIRDCTMGHNRARGLLIKASDGVIEDNLLEGVEGHGVQISQEYEWMEGGCSRNMSVKGNTLRHNGGGVYIAGNNCLRKPLPADAHRNFAITDNVFDGGYSGVAVVGCTGLDLRGNVFLDVKGEPYRLTNVAEVRRDEKINTVVPLTSFAEGESWWTVKGPRVHQQERTPGSVPFAPPAEIVVRGTCDLVCPVELVVWDSWSRISVKEHAEHTYFFTSTWNRVSARFSTPLPAGKKYRLRDVRLLAPRAQVEAAGGFTVNAIDGVYPETMAGVARFDVVTGTNGLHIVRDASECPEAVFRNGSDRTLRWKGTLRLADFFERKQSVPFDVTVPANGERRVRLPMPSAKGLWKLFADIEGEDGSKVSRQTRFAVLDYHGVTPRLPKGKFRIGLNYHRRRYLPKAIALCDQALVACGAKHSRQSFIGGSSILPKEPGGTCDFSYADSVVAEMKRLGIDIDCLLDWGGPRDRLERYGEEVAHHFGADMAYYEIGNEWELPTFFKLTTADAIDIATKLARGLKKGCPEATVTLCGWAAADDIPKRTNNPGIQRDLMQATKGLYDVHAMHLHGSYKGFRSRFVDLFLPNRAKWGIDVPIYMNETAQTTANANELDVAACVWKKIAFSWAYGSTDYIWYNLRATGYEPTDGEQGYGVMSADFHPRATYAALSAFTALFNGWDRPEILRSDVDGECYRFTGTREGEREIVLLGWENSEARSSRGVAVATDAKKVFLCDIMNNIRELPVENGRVVWPFGELPSALRLAGATKAEPDRTALMAKLPERVVRVKGAAEPDFVCDASGYVKEFYAADPDMASRIWKGPSDCSFKAWFGERMDGTNRYLVCRFDVTDDIVQLGSRMDRLRLTLESPSGIWESTYFRTDTGKKGLWVWKPKQDIGAKLRGELHKAVRYDVVRTGCVTRYTVEIPAAKFDLPDDLLGGDLKAAFFVIDADGEGCDAEIGIHTPRRLVR